MSLKHPFLNRTESGLVIFDGGLGTQIQARGLERGTCPDEWNLSHPQDIREITDYHTGNQFHLDLRAAEHLPLLGGIIGVGANGFYYQQITGPIITVSGSKSDKDVGFGDILIYPFMLGWTGLNGDLKYDFRLGIYAPTGNCEKGQLANVGKNYWTFEPMLR